MSYCELIEFKDGKPSDSKEYGNSWRGAARIWSSLYDRHLKSPNKPYDSWLTDKDRGRLWKLAVNNELENCERAVLLATFDYAIVRREHFTQFADDLRSFEQMYPVDHPSHLWQWALDIEDMDAEAIGFRHTSVAENLWEQYDENSDETVLYNLATGDRHFEVYDYLTELAATTPQPPE